MLGRVVLGFRVMLKVLSGVEVRDLYGTIKFFQINLENCYAGTYLGLLFPVKEDALW